MHTPLSNDLYFEDEILASVAGLGKPAGFLIDFPDSCIYGRPRSLGAYHLAQSCLRR